ncbi:MAG: GerW family sporulation protein [Lachnospiraceae bacterium]
MQENNFNTTVQSLFKGMDNFITTKTVVGDPIHIGDTIILPLIEVSFGVGAGAFCQDQKNNAAGGLGGKITPSAVLVIQNGTSKLVNVKNQDGITKILDMVPDFVEKFTSKENGKKAESKKTAADEKKAEAAAEDLAEKLNIHKEDLEEPLK